jgi:hypothetical protein
MLCFSAAADRVDKPSSLLAGLAAWRLSFSLGLQRREDFLCVTFGPDVGEDAGNYAGSYDERRAADPLAAYLLWAPNAEFAGDLMARV